MTKQDKHSAMLEEICHQPSRFSILGVICAYKEPIIKVDGQKTIDVHFKTKRGDVLVEYKCSDSHNDYASCQLREYASYLGLNPYRMVIITGIGRVMDI